MAKATTNMITGTAMAPPTAKLRRGPLSGELAARIDNAIARALATDFAVDPLLGPDMSRLGSFVSSVVKRDGTIIEASICAALRRHSHLTVMPQVRMPITVSAEAFVRSNSELELGKFAMSIEGATTRIAHYDMIVVDKVRDVAMLLEIKRGGGKTEAKKIRAIERDLACGRLQLKAYLNTLGIRVTRFESWVIDYHGRSGFPSSLTVTRDGLDELFGVPVAATTEAAARAMRQGMLAELPPLLERVREQLAVGAGPVPNENIPLRHAG